MVSKAGRNLTTMTTVTITIPDELVARLTLAGRTLEEAVVAAIEQYFAPQPPYNLFQSQTWQLCGSLEITDPLPPQVTEQQHPTQPTTNYAAHVDDVLYR